jgi:hypothetical protein
MVGHSDRILQTVQRETGAPDSSKGRAGIQAHSQETYAPRCVSRAWATIKPTEAEAHFHRTTQLNATDRGFINE